MKHEQYAGKPEVSLKRKRIEDMDNDAELLLEEASVEKELGEHTREARIDLLALNLWIVCWLYLMPGFNCELNQSRYRTSQLWKSKERREEDVTPSSAGCLSNLDSNKGAGLCIHSYACGGLPCGRLPKV